jgi:hypothetical protein
MCEVRFGIESYFVPQYEGRKIERGIRNAEVHVELAVGPSGHAALRNCFWVVRRFGSTSLTRSSGRSNREPR